jgi:D-serine deaminase-like pyridoxal phosphate-dependent protein
MKVEDLETPAAIVDLEILEDNIDRMAKYCRAHKLKLRPHTKTHKTPAIAQMQIESGSYGITVAKVGEAEVMARSGVRDLLVAYPVVGQRKLERLAALACEHRITVGLDSVEVAQGISVAAREAGCPIRVLLEFDVGMGRCGIQTVEKWVQSAQEIARLPRLEFGGLMLHAGHIWSSPREQPRQLEELTRSIEEILEAARTSGLECADVSGGNTPTAYSSHLVKGLTEIRPGTYVFNDLNEVKGGFCSLAQCAFRILVTVVSTAVSGRAVIDGGSKTFSGDRLVTGNGEGFGYVTEYPDVKVSAMWEEHGQLDVAASVRRPSLGERLSIIPNHVCTAVNMHDQIYYHRRDAVESVWTVEGRGKIH